MSGCISINILEIGICTVFNQEFNMVNFIGENSLVQGSPFHLIGKGVDIYFMLKKDLDDFQRWSKDRMVQKSPSVNVFEGIEFKRLLN